jgi:phage-related protein
MRFFNHALNDSDDLLDTLTKSMHNAGGEAKKAYKIMANTPAARVQELTNRYQIMRTEVGDRLIPIKMKLVEALITLLKAWDKLSPRMKDIVVKGAAIAAVLGIVLGAVLAVAGVFLMFKAGLALAGIGLGGLLGPIAIVIGVLALLGAAVFLVIKHWDKIGPVVKKSWDAIKKFAMSVASNVLPILKGIGAAILPILQQIGTGIVDVMHTVGSALSAAGKYMLPGIMEVWSALKDFGIYALDVGKKIWSLIGPILTSAFKSFKESATSAWNTIKTAVMGFWNAAKPAFSDFIITLTQVWGIVVMASKGIIAGLKPVLAFIAVVFVVGITVALAVLAAAFKFVTNFISQVWPPLLKAIGSVLGGIWSIIKNFVGFVYAIMKGDWKLAWEYAKLTVMSIFATIGRIVKGAGTILWGIIKGMVLGIIGFFKTLYNTLVGHSIIPDLVRAIIMWFTKLPGALLALARKIWTDVVAAFNAGKKNVLSVITTLVTNVKDKFNGAKKWLVDAGGDIISGLKSGITGAISGIGGWVKDHIVDPIVSAVKRHFGIKSPSTVMAGLGGHLVGGLIKGIIDKGMSGSQWVSKIFGGFGSALGNFIDHGITSFKSLPSRLWGTVKGLGGHFATMVKKAEAAKAALSAGGNGGYSGPVGSGSGGIKALARHFHPSYIAGHRDPQGGPAFDIGSSGGKNNNIANAMRANHGKLGLRYVISQMRIASARSGWRWRHYTPITNQGDFRHTGHVHVSYAKGGWINEHIKGIGMRSGKTYQFGEKGPEYVTPQGQATGRPVEVNVYTQEIDPTRHAAELGWQLAVRV